MIGCISALTALALHGQPVALPPRVALMVNIADATVVEHCDDLFEHGGWNELIGLLSIRYEQFPTDYEVATDYGWMLENVGHQEEALKVYRRYAVEAMSDRDRLLPEGTYWYRKKEHQKVIDLMLRSLDWRPHPNAYRMVGFSYEKLGAADDAIAVFKRLQKDYPDDRTAQGSIDRIERNRGTKA